MPRRSAEEETMRLRMISAAALAAVLASAAHAQAEGDLWEVTVRMEMPGMPAAMPATTQRMCIPKAASDDQYVPRQGDCTITESRRSGNMHRYKMRCAGKDAFASEGEITHTKDAYEGRARMSANVDGSAMEMMQTFSGRKVGACANPRSR
jgi:hypothetical protein